MPTNCSAREHPHSSARRSWNSGPARAISACWACAWKWDAASTPGLDWPRAAGGKFAISAICASIHCRYWPM